MNLEEPLQFHSLDELLEMYMDAATILYDSKINEEAPGEIKDKEKLVDDLQKAIVAKQAELPPLK